jgi:hypothetical protein
MSTDVSEELAASIFKVEEEAKHAAVLSSREDGDSKFHLNVSALVPDCTALHPRRRVLFMYDRRKTVMHHIYRYTKLHGVMTQSSGLWTPGT